MSKRGPRAHSLAGSWLSRLEATAVDDTVAAWPDEKWQADPLGFAREILGVEVWDRQSEFIEAVRDNPLTAVRSGHRVSKTMSLGIIALWFYCAFPEARVIMTAPTAPQLSGALWRTIRMLYHRSGICLACRKAKKTVRPCEHSNVITGDIHALVQSGIKSEDFREIFGITADKPEALQGLAGINLLFIADEASGVDDKFFEVLIAGNMAGGGRLVMCGNPTKTHGEFFDAFHSKRNVYHTIHISSLESPNIRAKKTVVPGLADNEWLATMKALYGEGTPIYRIRVNGEFALEDGAVLFSLAAIEAAELRWEAAKAEGGLHIGIDVAGEGLTGDETAMQWRRGLRHLGTLARRGMSPHAILQNALGVLKECRQQLDAIEWPTITVDRDGAEGARCYDVFRSYLNEHEGAYRLIGFRGGDVPSRLREVYKLQRDLLFANLLEWFRDGGAIQVDPKLQAELGVLKWIDNERGKQVLIRKDELRKILGRSPDRLDALALSCWGEVRARQLVSSSNTPDVTPTPPTQVHDEPPPDALFDPYEALGGGGEIDPYG